MLGGVTAREKRKDFDVEGLLALLSVGCRCEPRATAQGEGDGIGVGKQ